MANGKGTALGIIGIIVGVSGLGLGVYSTINFQLVEGPQGLEGLPGLDGTDGLDGINGEDGLNGTLDNLVAVWETLTGYGAPAPDFFVAFDDIRFNRSDFFNLSASNTNITLTRAGWYRFSIRLLFSGLFYGPYFQLDINKNGTTLEMIDRVERTEDPYYCVNVFVYVLSDGDDFFRFRCRSNGGAFNIYGGQQYNQAIIEYVGEIT